MRSLVGEEIGEEIGEDFADGDDRGISTIDNNRADTTSEDEGASGNSFA
jgi:hypothetical protein